MTTNTNQILRDALQDERNWLESQRKAISKGCGSSWDMGQCDEHMGLIDAAMSATGATEAPMAYGFVHVNTGTFMSAVAYAATQRNQDLLESGEVVMVYTAPPSPTPAAEEVTGAAAFERLLIEASEDMIIDTGEYRELQKLGMKYFKSAPPPALPGVADFCDQHCTWLDHQPGCERYTVPEITRTDLSIPAPAIDTSGERVEAVKVGAARYEFVRTLHPHEFAQLVARNIAGEGKFDDLVDVAIQLRERQAAYGAECMELGKRMAEEGGK